MAEEDVENTVSTKQIITQTNAMKDVFLDICLLAGMNLVFMLAGDSLRNLSWKISYRFFNGSNGYLTFFNQAKFATTFFINISVFIYLIVKRPRMIIKFDNLLQKTANWKTVLALFIISFPFGYYIDKRIFYMVPRFDYLYLYSVDAAYDLISDFQTIGILKAYITYELTFQVFFPFATALFFTTFIYHAGNGLVPKKILIPFALIIPTATLLIDYLENAGLIILILSFHGEPGRAITYLSFVSQLKNTVEITSSFATMKGFLWDVQWYIFLAGIALYLLKVLGFFINKIGILEKFKKTKLADEQGNG